MTRTDVPADPGSSGCVISTRSSERKSSTLSTSAATLSAACRTASVSGFPSGKSVSINSGTVSGASSARRWVSWFVALDERLCVTEVQSPRGHLLERFPQSHGRSPRNVSGHARTVLRDSLARVRRASSGARGASSGSTSSVSKVNPSAAASELSASSR